MKKALQILLLAILAGASSLPVAAEQSGDAALYDERLPEDAAFIRFVGFEELAELTFLGLVVSGERLVSGNYNVVSGNEVEGIEPGQFLTVVPGASGHAVSIVEPERDERKVLLGLINLATTDLSLKTADGQAAIIEAVASGAASFRAVNPIVVSVMVFEDSTGMGSPYDLALQRSEHRTFVAHADGTVTQLISTVLSERLQ